MVRRVLLVAMLAGVLPAHATGEAVASLGVGESAFWEAAASPGHPSGGPGPYRDYPIEVREEGAVLRVALDRRNSSAELVLIAPDGSRQGPQSGWYSFELFAENPAPGTWIARALISNASQTGFRMRARLEGAPPEKPSPPVPMLPNLRMVPPYHFTFGSPGLGAPGVNCSAQEIVETSARSCLRFSLGPANAGPGPLLVRFAPLEGLATRGTAYQRVFDSDGGWTERAAGEFEYHKTHMHYHHSGFGALELFEVLDPATGELAPAGAGPKQGFCTGDVLMWDWTGFSQPRARVDSECVDEAARTGTNRPLGTTMGLTAGWADLYSWSQDGMYVEWGGNEDGLYVVRASADSSDWILEASETDNTSYAYVSVSRGAVNLLERGYGTDPWDPDRRLAGDRLQ